MSIAALSNWILLAPLLVGAGLCAWELRRTRAPRAAISGLLLLVLFTAQLLDPAPPFEGFAELVLGDDLALLSIRFVVYALAAATAWALVRSLAERDRAEQVQWRSMEAVRSLGNFFGAERGPFAERVRELLAIGCRELGLSAGILSRITGDRSEIVAIHAPDGFERSEGDAIPLAETFCRETIAGDRPFASCAGDRSRRSTRRTPPGQESYLGMPLRVDGELYGTLSFESPEPRRRRFTGVDKQILELMAHWIEAELSHLAASRQKRLVPRRGNDADRRGIDVNAAVSQLEEEVREAVAPDVDLVLDLGELDGWARMYRYEFDRIYWSLVLHGARCCAAGKRMRATTRVVPAAPDSPAGGPAGFITLSITSPGSGDSDSFGRLPSPPVLHPNKEVLLSLPRVRKLLESLGGDLSIESEKGVGTTFTAWLPNAPEAVGPDDTATG